VGVTPDPYRRENRPRPGPPKDLTEVWEKYTPLEQAPEQVLERVRYFCESKRITAEALSKLETRFRVDRHGGVVLAYPRYARLNGRVVVCAVKRRPLDQEQPRNAEPGSRIGPPAEPQVVGNRKSNRWFVVEGETDAARLWLLTGGQAAIVSLGGTSGVYYKVWDKTYPPEATVFIALDSDRLEPGEQGLRGEEAAAILLERLPNAIRLRPPAGAKDWCDWDGDAEAFSALLMEAVSQNGEPTEDINRIKAPVTDDDDAPESYVKPTWNGPPPRLAGFPDILAELRRDLDVLGVGGETSLTQLVYLALTSRVLPWEPTSRPVSVIAKGTSSSGKSHVVSTVIRFFPSQAVIRLTSASNLYLLYDERSLSHSFIFVPEWTTIAEKDEFVSMLRVLVSEGRIEHGTVEGQGRKGTRLLTKEGPTGLIMTTTAALTEPELETRCFSVRTDDTPKQTRSVFKTLSKNHLEGNPGIDFDRWIEFQVWIEAQENQVLVPFSDELAELMPNSAVRLRRDFVTILCLIQAHAILYQAQRQRDNSGRIVATLADYEAVRSLTDVLVAEEAGGGITPAMKETVEAVQAIIDGGSEHATVEEIAGQLKIGGQATRDRVARAQVAGLLENVSETRKKRLKVAGELPEGTTFLPTLEAIKALDAREPSRRSRRSEIGPQTRMDKGIASSDAISEADRSKDDASYSEHSPKTISEVANPRQDRGSDTSSEAPSAPRGVRGDGVSGKGLESLLGGRDNGEQEALDLKPGWLARSLAEDEEE
jgi:hypothetical protein